MPRDQEVVQPVSLSALAGSCAEARRAPERRAHAEADAGGGHTGMRLDIIVSANLAQGNLSKGQHALALVYPDSLKSWPELYCRHGTLPVQHPDRASASRR
jgi:hypothetical protein